MTHYLTQILIDQGLSELWAYRASLILTMFVGLFISLFIAWFTKHLLRKVLLRLAENTKTSLDDMLIKNRVPNYLSYMVGLYFFDWILQGIDTQNETIITQFLNGITALQGLIAILIIRAILNAVKDQLKNINTLKDKPLDSYFQVILGIIWFLGGIAILSLLTGKSITTYLTALGALSAVLLLIFKDTLLGFVASIQISINDTVRIGDWISMPNQNADGDVIGISLSTVLVRNFDNTITSIPTYKLISDAFVNWRGMDESEGRRIKRQLLIQTSSVQFLSPQDVAEMTKIERIGAFIAQKTAEIESENNKKNVNKSLLINGRNLTNIGLFRSYIQFYLEQHSAINQELTVMCRQLNPTQHGIPLQIYAFSKNKTWVHYEGVAADIIDHCVAAAPYFKLRIFEWQTPHSAPTEV